VRFSLAILYLYRYNIAMPNKIEQLTTERQALLAQLQSIERLRRGSLSRQVYTKNQAGQDRTQGPYFVLQGFHKGKKFSQRVPAAQAHRVQEQVNNFKRFQQLADQCVSATDELTQLTQAQPDGKKNSSRRKSIRRASGKPRPS